MIVAICIELAMDHKPSHRELSSVLISDLYLKVISQRDIGKGNFNPDFICSSLSVTIVPTLFLAFDYLLHQLPDLILDTPDAPEVLGNFLARAIADDCIPPKFLHRYVYRIVHVTTTKLVNTIFSHLARPGEAA